MSRTTRKRSQRPLQQPHLGSIIRNDRLSQQQRESRRNTLLWAGLLGGAVVWAAWPDEETGVTLTSRADCASVTKVTVAECQAAYDTAAAEDARLAPRFDDRSHCDQQFGTCHQDPGNAQHWIPPMGGFLLGYALGGGSSYRYTGALPLYRDRRGEYLNPNGGYVSSGVGKVRGAAGNPAPPARAITVSRSGFGSVAGARSSFGG